jgi:hypothetical protein
VVEIKKKALNVHMYKTQYADSKPGLPDGIFQTTNPNLGTFSSVLLWKMLIYFISIWCIFWSFGMFYVLVHFWLFGMLWYVVARKIWQPCSKRMTYIRYCPQVLNTHTGIKKKCISGICSFVYFKSWAAVTFG